MRMEVLVPAKTYMSLCSEMSANLPRDGETYPGGEGEPKAQIVMGAWVNTDTWLKLVQRLQATPMATQCSEFKFSNVHIYADRQNDLDLLGPLALTADRILVVSTHDLGGNL